MTVAHQMNRRGLLGAGAALTALAAGVAAAGRVRAQDVATLAAHNGQEVVLTGRLVAGPAGHYLTLVGKSGDAPVRVFPSDARLLGAARAVSVKGRLHVGKFPDAVTGEMAPAVLMGARWA